MEVVGLYNENSDNIENSVRKSIVEECVSGSEKCGPLIEKKTSRADIMKYGKWLELIMRRDHSVSNDPSGLNE